MVLPFSVNAEEIPKVQRPDELEDVIDFLLECVYTRLTTPEMPISPRSILYTILGTYFNEISHEIEVVNEPTMQETLDVNAMLENRAGLPVHDLGRLAALVTMSAVVTYNGYNFVNYIRVRQ